MNRFFTADIHDNTARITGEDVRHISRVLRMKPGDGIEICDGNATEYSASIVRIEPDAVLCSISGKHASEAESIYRITLFQGIPKSGKMETIIQKCVELGAAGIVPVQMERCVPLPGKDAAGKLSRYRKVAAEAAKQSKRGVIPEVGMFWRLSDIDFSGYDTVIAAYELEQRTGLKEVLKRGTGRNIAVVIGPEGGITEEEIRMLEQKGAAVVSLGARILRTETAGMAVVAQILYELDG